MNKTCSSMGRAANGRVIVPSFVHFVGSNPTKSYSLWMESAIMKGNQKLPTREGLDQAFTILQDQITRITVEEEEEMMKLESQNSSQK